MYEFHGWCTIRETATIQEEKKMDVIVRSIQTYIDNFNWVSGFIDLRPINGEYHLSISGFTNHKSKESEDVFALYNYIAQIAIGSYGFLFIRDDEDIHGNNNEFQIYALARGKISKHKDQFLSPFVPLVEDEWKD